MLDFYRVKNIKKGKVGSEYFEVFPDFKVKKSKDLMIRGGTFYAIWNENLGLWSTDEYDVQRIIDRSLSEHAEELAENTGAKIIVKYLGDFSTSTWSQFRLYLSKLSDNYMELDSKVTFLNTDVQKFDFVSKRLSYPIEEGETQAFDALFSTLYDEANLQKIKWAIGSILSGESANIQKFFVFFGLPGTGKSTTLNLIERLLEGYTTSFEAASITSSNSAFALEPFKNNPLVAIDHEGDLSKIRNNSLLTSIVSHDKLVMNLKYQHPFPIRLATTLMIATNKPVMITDRASGIIRRLIDVRPTGKVVSSKNYSIYNSQIMFELGHIAYKCLETFKTLGKNYYDRYVPLDMIYRTNVFFNFVDEYYFDFARDDYITLGRAWDLYKAFCDETGVVSKLNRHAFRDEMKNYWKEFHGITRIDGKQLRSVYVGFNKKLFSEESSLNLGEPVVYDWLLLDESESIFDSEFASLPAQLANSKGIPKESWDRVKTTLSDIDTSATHFMLPPDNLITIDFDLKDSHGNKSLELNLDAARAFPPTYAEVSKGGLGLHLYYYYDGDVSALSRIYAPGIEILKPTGLFSIRRRVSKCNNHEITTISTGLPIKEPAGGSMFDSKTIGSEKSLRTLILRNLNKEIHPATKPSMDFIDKILWDAYESGLAYDVSDMRPYILNFASKSTNNAHRCLEIALLLPYSSEGRTTEEPTDQKEERLVFFDVEVFPNLFIVCWKFEGSDTVTEMINPSSSDITELLEYRLVGYNNRRYDNHILYGAYLGYHTEELFDLSARIISNDNNALFGQAYNLSYVDVYDYLMVKQSLKKWEVDLGLRHSELELPWDKPVDKDMIPIVVEYCKDDVRATEHVHNHRQQDFKARLILARLSGLPVNSSTAAHTSQIIFQGDKNHKDAFVYPDLSEEFPGYTFELESFNPDTSDDDNEYVRSKRKWVSKYKGEEVGEGGYVYAEPGIHKDVVYMDIASMHPTSLEVMGLFGKYTKRFSSLKETRIMIKEGRLDEARLSFDGKIAEFLDDEKNAPDLAYALKIALNIVYGYTAAHFDNDFRDSRNKDNVVAKRGALFMVDLKEALIERGCKPVHFKTDSVKIANFKPEDVDFVIEFGKRYGYDFGVEAIFEKMALINDAVLVAKEKSSGVWHAVGARFAHPFVYKTLFSKEELEFSDFCEVHSVRQGNMYIEDDNGVMIFIGRVGKFCPMRTGGGILYRVKDGKKYAVTGTKGYKWLTSEVVETLDKKGDIDIDFFKALVDESVLKIKEFGDVDSFLE